MTDSQLGTRLSRCALQHCAILDCMQCWNHGTRLEVSQLEALRTESSLSSDVITTRTESDEAVDLTDTAVQHCLFLQETASRRRLKCREIDVVFNVDTQTLAGVAGDYAWWRDGQRFHQFLNWVTGVEPFEVRRLTDHFWHNTVTNT